MPYKDPEKQKEAQRRYYQDNKDLYLTRNRIKRSKIRQTLMDIKEKNPCADCHMNYPYYMMDFDHRPDETKLFNLSNLGNASTLEKALEEIAKCDVVCANCHRHRTWSRATGHSQLSDAEWTGIGASTVS